MAELSRETGMPFCYTSEVVDLIDSVLNKHKFPDASFFFSNSLGYTQDQIKEIEEQISTFHNSASEAFILLRKDYLLKLLYDAAVCHGVITR